ncbi:MAG: hypothetical protein M1358_21505 [Chloroflexi bacterium]|nr:hypothetical protein [Chloroflexota bacterium]
MYRKLILTVGLAGGTAAGVFVAWKVVASVSERLVTSTVLVTGSLAVASAVALTLLLLLSPYTQEGVGAEFGFGQTLLADRGIVVTAIKTPFVAVIVAGIVVVAAISVFFMLFGCGAIIDLLVLALGQFRTLLG